MLYNVSHVMLYNMCHIPYVMVMLYNMCHIPYVILCYIT